MTVTPPRQPPPPPRPGAASERESWPVGRTIAIVATVLLLGGSIAAAVVLSRGSDEKPAAARSTTDAAARDATPEAPPEATATPDDAQLPRQVETLDRLLKMSVEGRAEALGGDFAAAAESRSTLLRELRSLQADVTDAQLRAAVTAFIAAIREALRQNRECTASCSTSELERVGRLKRQALSKINPLLREQGIGTYKSSEI